MKLSQAISNLGFNRAKDVAREQAILLNLDWNSCVKYIFQACLDNPSLIPKIGSNNDTDEGVINKWVNKYKDGYNKRISQRSSNLPATIADPIIDYIIKERLPDLDTTDLEKIKFAHRLSMTAENILGDLLEEYLSIHLEPRGWHCAWGMTVKKVDFCSNTGELLQIKNRSNSENSSSSQVRDGTDILKWYRVNADTGDYSWSELNNDIGTSCSEDSFRVFVKKTLRLNSGAFAIEPTNPWSTPNT